MGERKIIPNGEPQVIAQARIGALMNIPVLRDSGNGYEEIMFEKFVRPPGTRIIAVKDNKIFIQKEARLEQNNEFDWRLPGGKVMDSFEEYKEYIGKEIPEEIIYKAGLKELREEGNLEAKNIKLFKKSICGSLVEWDLYYLIAEDITPVKHIHDEGEEIIDGNWLSFDEILSMCKKGEINEDRTISALYQFINK